MLDYILIVNILIIPGMPVFSLEDSRCCSMTHFDLCGKVCNKLVRYGRVGNLLHRVLAVCPYGEEVFWQCIRKNMNVSKVVYSHHNCCSNAKTPACAVECFQSKTAEQVHKICDSNREMEVRRCLNKYRIERKCCSKGTSKGCRNTCKQIIASGLSKNSTKATMLLHVCTASPNVLTCLGVNGHKIELGSPYLRCCRYGKTIMCQQKCQELFSTLAVGSSVIKKLNLICGQTNPQSRLYRCILEIISNPEIHEENRAVTFFKNSNLLQGYCCTVAQSPTCKRWCYQTFSSISFIRFEDPLYAQCMENPKEYELSTCVGDVLEPCRFGCKGILKFCANFNNRSLELFRRCDAHADKKAENLFISWKSGDFSSFPIKVAVQNITYCKPKEWKALACTLVIKPCSRKSNRNQICRTDCVSLLESCLLENSQEAADNAEKICMTLMPNPDQSDCIRSSNYVEPKMGSSQQLGTFPCQNDPCNTNRVCSVNNDCGNGRQSQWCHPYSCIPGCSLGAPATIKIRNRSFFKTIYKSGDKTCNKVCQCFVNDVESSKIYNRLSCTNTTCYQNLPCAVNGQLKEHKSRFVLENVLCTCFGGELICTKKLSSSFSFSWKDRSCNCDVNIFNPVCGVNGVTYHSICLARCDGLEDAHISLGSCSQTNSCNPSPCMPRLICMPRKRVCLHSMLLCPQYDCVKPGSTLKMIERCTLDNNQIKECNEKPYLQQCCKGNCYEKLGKVSVCGLDSVTYISYCAAATQLVPIDYEGPCAARDSLLAGKHRCKAANCKRRHNCNVHVPVGGCCPICDPFVRVLYSRSEARSHIEQVSPIPIVVRDIIEQLSFYVHASQCSVRGYMSIEGDIIVIIQSNAPERNLFQEQICGREAERLSSLINTRSPIITTNYYLSIIKAAFIQYPKTSISSGSILVNANVSTTVPLIVMVNLFTVANL